ncbi:hypothetical protein [Streptomyces albicerus]|uniref:hypothetical protein n=1 Tax=Streptomyces albicerus TaxID=2569859 RepID=UPI00124B3382|nr:hypothetical protein [Streptomyces albicerus]
MNRRPTLLAAIAPTAPAALSLSACGSDDGSEDKDKIVGADAGALWRLDRRDQVRVFADPEGYAAPVRGADAGGWRQVTVV